MPLLTTSFFVVKTTSSLLGRMWRRSFHRHMLGADAQPNSKANIDTMRSPIDWLASPPFGNRISGRVPRSPVLHGKDISPNHQQGRGLHKPTFPVERFLTESRVRLILAPPRYPHPDRSSIRAGVPGAEGARRLLGRQRRASSPLGCRKAVRVSPSIPGQRFPRASSVGSHNSLNVVSAHHLL